MYRFVYYLLYPFFRLFCHFKVYGRENIPKGNFIIIANHTAYKDPVILAYAVKRKNIRFIAKDDLQRFWFFRFLFKSLGVIAIKRNSSDLNAIRRSVEALENGDSLCIFPQGTRIKGEAPTKEQALAGVGLIIAKSKCDVLPIAIKYPENAGGSRKIKVTIGKPISYDEYMKPDENGEPPRRVDTARIVFDEVCKLHAEL
jgi:1-acyl-sn-glycerol-3-phosphate acyltransferase